MRALVGVLLALIMVLSACGRRGFDAPNDSVQPGYCNTATFENAAASSLVDDFSTPIDDDWRVIDLVSPCLAQVGSELVATPPDSMPKYCYAYTRADYHLTCSSIFFKVPQVTSPILKAQTFIYVTPLPDTGDYFRVILEGGGLQMGSGIDAPRATSAFDPASDVWWRLTEHDGETTFDASVDGAAWRERMRLPTTLLFDHVEISIGAGTYTPAPPSPGQARFRCYNVPPPCN